MPNYYNPYGTASYFNQSPMNYGYAQPYQAPVAPFQQSYVPSTGMAESMRWVEGEIGAKAYQMPAGWPANTPIALWDSTDTVIYLKSVNQMGIPNPMQRLKYTIEEQPSQALLNGTQNSASGAQAPVEDHADKPDMSQYVTKQEMEQLQQEIRNLRQTSISGNNQNGSYSSERNNGNRGGNR